MSNTDPIEKVVDEVYAAFADKRDRLGLRCAAGFAVSGLDSLAPFQQLAQDRVMQFIGTFNVDRKDVITILKKWFADHETKVDREAVKDAIQQNAQDQLKAELVADGMHDELAARVWDVFSITVYIPD